MYLISWTFGLGPGKQVLSHSSKISKYVFILLASETFKIQSGLLTTFKEFYKESVFLILLLKGFILSCHHRKGFLKTIILQLLHSSLVLCPVIVTCDVVIVRNAVKSKEINVSDPDVVTWVYSSELANFVGM